jgi:hypothetical protein
MLEFLKRDTMPRYMPVDQFIKITQLSFLDYHSLREEGKVPIVKKDGESFVDLVAMAEMVAEQKDEEPS